MSILPFTPIMVATGDLDTVVTTNDAATALNRKPQTLRKWATYENGPIRPIRIHGRLAWRVRDIRALLEAA